MSKKYNIFRVLRGCFGLTQTEVAERSGVSSIYIHELEVGTKRKPSDGILLKIAESYGLGLQAIKFYMENEDVDFSLIFRSALQGYFLRKQAEGDSGDLISRIELIEKIDGTDWYHISESGNLVHGANSQLDTPLFKADDIFSALENAPAVDVDSEYKHSFERIAAKYAKIQDKLLKGELEEVVRCRDCKHGKPNGNGTYYCYQDKFAIRLDLKPDHYCAYGDRRADE